MKGRVIDGTPPGYYTVKEVCAVLEMSRTNFYKTGLSEALPRWRIGTALLYRRKDVAKLREWLAFREARLAEGDYRYHEVAPGWLATIDDAMDAIESWEDSQTSKEIVKDLLG